MFIVDIKQQHNKNNNYFRGSNSAIFSFSPLLTFFLNRDLNRDHLLQQKHCCTKSKFFPLRVDHILEWIQVSRKLKVVTKVVIICLKNGITMEVYPNGWMEDLRFYVLFNSISAISGQWDVDNERLCAITEPRLRLRKFRLERGSNSRPLDQ